MLSEAASDRYEQSATEALTLYPREQVDLVQLAAIARDTAVVGQVLGESHQLAPFVFDDKAEAPVVCTSSLVTPLLLAELVGGASGQAVAVRLIECSDVQPRKCGNVGCDRLPKTEGLGIGGVWSL